MCHTRTHTQTYEVLWDRLNQQVIVYYRLAVMNEEELDEMSEHSRYTLGSTPTRSFTLSLSRSLTLTHLHTPPLSRFYMQPVSFRNEIAALAAAREAYVKWLAKHKTSIEEDEAVCLCCTAVPPACGLLLTDYNAAAVLQLQRTANLPGRTAVALAYRLTRKRIALQQIRWLEAMSTLAQCVNKQVCHTCQAVCVLHGSPSPQSHP